MSEDHVFVDTGILIHAHDLDAGKKHEVAAQKVSDLWNRDMLPGVSVQVLNEFYYHLIRKGVPQLIARDTTFDYLQWDVVDNDRSLFFDGISVQERWKVAFWDALILAAAKRAKATVLWSENFNSGQDFDGLLVVNPLI